MGPMSSQDHSVIRWEQEGQSRGEIGQCYTSGFEDGGRGREPKNAGSFWKLETAKSFSPRSSRRNAALPTTKLSPGVCSPELLR